MKRTILSVAVLVACASQASAGLTARYLLEGDKTFAEDITCAVASNFGIYAHGSGNAGTFTGQTISVDVSEAAGLATGVYAGKGGKIVIGARHDTLFEEITQELGADNCWCQVCDVTNRAQVDALVQAAYDKFNGFDVMFGNAGINLFKDFLNVTEEEHARIVHNNYFGCFNSTQAAARAFVAHETKGAIVNTASINVRCACPNSTPYAASKGAIATMTQGVAVELAEYGIRANCFCPGSTDTPMVTEVPRTRFPTYTAPKLMIQRMAQPEEQANIACFLASDDASYITGETIFCVGGWGKK